MKNHMSWNDRFALIDAFKPSDDQIMTALSVSKDELTFAREMRASGYFAPSNQLSISQYEGIFTGTMVQVEAPMRPLSATTKKIKIKKRRGRKGDKIMQAFAAIPATPVDVVGFSKQYGISIPVLRQSKRFLQAMDPTVANSLGTINVRKDKVTKKLVIWRS